MARFERFRISRVRPGKPRLLLGIHPLPTMVTLGNLICGFASIMLAMRANAIASAVATGHYKPEDYLYFSGLLIFIGMIFDVMDGGVARLTKSTSKFGMELDSLCDVVSFGVAPAVLVYNLLEWQARNDFVLPWLDRYLFPMLIVYVTCAVLRLARYNVESESGPVGYFFGMPSPGAAGCAAGLVILALPATHHWPISPLTAQVSVVESYLPAVRSHLLVALPFIMVGLGILMVSREHNAHIGRRFLRGKRSFMQVIILSIMLGLVLMHHEIMLALAFNGYLLLGLLNELRMQLFPKQRPPEWSDKESVPAEPMTEVPQIDDGH